MTLDVVKTLNNNKQTIYLWGGGIAQLVKRLVGDPGDWAKNPVTAITFGCAAIHLPTVYNLQCHQRPVHLIRCLYGVAG